MVSDMSGKVSMADEVLNLKRRMGAVILAHNYQRPEIQDLADFVGDSLQLSVEATKVDQQVIVFCGVSFMAETAKILNPKKEVLIPRRDARCPMADMAPAADVARASEEYPNAAVVCYVNTNADVKALSDVCCTSSNAVDVVNSMGEEEIILVPDANLASYVSTRTRKTIIPWRGFCYVHAGMTAEEAMRAKETHRNATLLVHPECPPEVTRIADRVLSTGGMIRFAHQSDAKEFLIGTEAGILHRLQKENPGKRFMPAGSPRVCVNMKRIGVRDLWKSLSTGNYRVQVGEETRVKAERALRRMLEAS